VCAIACTHVQLGAHAHVCTCACMRLAAVKLHDVAGGYRDKHAHTHARMRTHVLVHVLGGRGRGRRRGEGREGEGGRERERERERVDASMTASTCIYKPDIAFGTTKQMVF